MAYTCSLNSRNDICNSARDADPCNSFSSPIFYNCRCRRSLVIGHIRNLREPERSKALNMDSGTGRIRSTNVFGPPRGCADFAQNARTNGRSRC